MLNWDFIRDVGYFKWLVRTAQRQWHKRVLRRDHRFILPSGQRIVLPNDCRFTSEVFITNADVDLGSERILFEMLERRGCFIDIGANIGYYSLYMAPKVTEIFAFEPDPRVRQRLTENLATCQARIEAVAMGDKQGRARFHLGVSSEVSSLLANGSTKGMDIEVDVTTIDDYVAAKGVLVEAIKTDAEGKDFAIIVGGERVLREQQPIVLTEARPEAPLFEFVARLNYHVFAAVCDATTRRRWFTEFTSEPAPSVFTKMLFLVPERLTDRFRERVSCDIH